MNELEKQVLSARQALVRIMERDAGNLEMVASDEFSFEYRPAYRQEPHPIPISLAMPVRVEPYRAQTLHPFFDNLLFEGDSLRIAETYYNLSRRSVVDRFKLLLVTGLATPSVVKVLPIVAGRPIEELYQQESLAPPPLAGKLTTNYGMDPAYPESCPVCLRPEPPHSSCHKSLCGKTIPIELEAYSAMVCDT